MKRPLDTGTAVVLLVGAILAVATSLALAERPPSMVLGALLVLAVLILAAGHTEWALYLLIFSMLLGPQVRLAQIGGARSLGRGLTLRLDDLLLAIIGLQWLARTAVSSQLGIFVTTPLNRPIAAYVFVVVLATGLGALAGRVGIPEGALFVAKYIQYFVIYFMVVNCLRERRQFDRFLLALFATAVMSSVIGVGQVLSGQRVSALFEHEAGEPATFGGYLVLMLAVVSGLYLTSESPRRKLTLACLGALMTVPLLFSMSRGSYLAVIPMVGTLFVLSDRRWRVAAFCLVCIALAPVLMPKRVVDRILYTVSEAPIAEQVRVGGVRVDLSTSERFIAAKVAVVQLWPQQPLLGHGVTGHPPLDAQYPRVLVETGLVGLLAFLWIQIRLARRTYAVWRTTADPVFKGVSLGLLAGFVALMTHAVGANTFTIVRIMEPFWFLAGMVMTVPRLEGPPSSPGASA